MRWALVGLALLVSTGAAAQQRCGERTELLKQLASLYHESPVAVGISDGGSLLEIIASPDGSTWTAIVTRSNGVSCVVMTGEQWQGAMKGRGA